MRRPFLASLSLWFIIAGSFAIGCGKAPVPPTPLAVDQIAPELQRVFAKAQPQTRELIDEIASEVQTNGYPAAFQAVQILSAVPGVTKEQQFMTTRAMLTLNGLLQTAQAQGDQNASAALKAYLRNK